jgi:RNA polymerase sigma-70 factor, ECF subfamily
MAGVERSSDRDLIERFRRGDREAFTAIYRAHYAAVFRFALHMTGNRGRAIEVTQDVFVWLIHHPDGFDPKRGELPAFLTGVARKMLRRQRQEDRRWVPFEDAAVPESVEGQPEDFARAQDAAALRRAICALPERYREAVVLCDLEGKSYEEAAALLGCAMGTVRSRLHRARGLLARKLQGRQESHKCSV